MDNIIQDAANHSMNALLNYLKEHVKDKDFVYPLAQEALNIMLYCFICKVVETDFIEKAMQDSFDKIRNAIECHLNHQHGNH